MSSLLGAIAFGLLASGWLAAALGLPVWEFETQTRSSFGVLAAAYLAASVLNQLRLSRDAAASPLSFVMDLVTVVAGVASAIVLLGLRNVSLSKQTIVSALCASVFVVGVTFLLRHKPSFQRALWVGFIALVLGWNIAASNGAFQDPKPVNPFEYIPSQHYGIGATHYRLPGILIEGDGIPIPPRGYRVEPGGGIREGGGIVKLEEGYLLVSGAGRFYTFDRPPIGQAIAPVEHALRVPINSDAFRDAVGGDTAVRYWNFRVQDIYVQSDGPNLRVFASHHYWREEGDCYVVRVSSIEVPGADFSRTKRDADWETIFEASPCLAIKKNMRGQRFAGEESGGKLALLGESTLLVTLGDHEHDGLNSETILAQDPEASYGKIIAIEIPSWRASIFSVGHRNPQGIFVGSDQVVWSTEHGPEGGDELNRVERDGNYGWPFATYGVDYGLDVWPLTRDPGSHAGYREPVYAWVPSIGVSSLVGVESNRFETWRGDLLVGSLRDRGLWRMRIRNGGLVVNERIEVGVRVRDAIEGHGGEIVLWSDETPEVVFLEPAGERKTPVAAFAVCRGCHATSTGTSSIGPNLAGVVGRDIATLSKYAYSQGLSQQTGDWSEEALDTFLTDPQAFAPGTSMALPGMTNPRERRLVIEYLKSI